MKILRASLLSILLPLITMASVTESRFTELPFSLASLTRFELNGVPLHRWRPTLSGPEYLRSKPHVLVHYTTSGSDSTTYAHAESLAVFSESAWVRIERFGWAMPAPDQGLGGDDRLDIYIRGVASIGSVPDSNYTNPYPDGYSCYHGYDRTVQDYNWLRLVTTHEVHHSCQARYELRDDVGGWSAENTSNWIVWKVFSNCLDIYYFSRDPISPVSTPWLSIDHTDSLDRYAGGGALWFMFLDLYYSSDTPRRIWDLRGLHVGEHTFSDMDSVLKRDFHSNLDYALGHYAIWRYFTGSRDDNLHFSLAESLRTCVVHAQHTTFPANGNQGSHGPRGPGGVCPIEFINSSGQGLLINFDGQNGYAWRVYVVGIRNGESHEQLMQLDGNNVGSIQIPSEMAETAVLLPVVVSRYGDHDSTPALNFTYSASLVGDRVGLNENLQSLFLLNTRSQNPVRSNVTITYTLPKEIKGNLTIMDVTGRQIRKFELIGNGLQANITWNRTDHAGRKVNPGIYFYQLSANRRTICKKMVVE